MHFASRKDLVVETRNSFEAVLNRVKLHQSHILLIRVTEDPNCFDFAELAEDVVQDMLLTGVLLQRTHVQGLRRRIYS